jgi:transposase
LDNELDNRLEPRRTAVTQYVGLDVGLAWTSICVIDQDGAVVWRGRSPSEVESIAAAVRARAPAAAVVGLETGALATWLWHGLRQQGLPVVCLDARDAKAMLARQRNKTDANDALGLAHLVRSGWYRAVAVKSLAAHRLQCLLRTRAHLIAMRRDLANHLRGTLKIFGLKLGRGRGQALARRVRELVAGDPTLVPLAESLLAVWDAAGQQLAELDRRVLAVARRSAACRRLMTVPGVGAITALAFAAVIDQPQRFARSSSVGAYLGLTPRRHQSGEVDDAGRISRWGDGALRGYLYEAAVALLSRHRGGSALKTWGQGLIRRPYEAAHSLGRRTRPVMLNDPSRTRSRCRTVSR